jgi:DNA-directed RNA polymerase subunit M/transcription elongation factor TFIIS
MTEFIEDGGTPRGPMEGRPILPKVKRISSSIASPASALPKKRRLTVPSLSDGAEAGGKEEEGGGEPVTKKPTRRGKNAAAAAAADTIKPKDLDRLQHGVTKKQRHFILKSMLDAVKKHTSCDPTPHEATYIKTVEQTLYDGIFGANLHCMYNPYLADLYRQKAFELLAGLRQSAPYLMKTYSSALLAALPPHLASLNTAHGKDYKDWKDRKDYEHQIEMEMRVERANEKGEGFLACPKCGGKFDMTMLQMRAGDEPSTIFLTCRNCKFTRRKG